MNIYIDYLQYYSDKSILDFIYLLIYFEGKTKYIYFIWIILIKQINIYV